MEKKPLIILTGPTAAGKTKLSVALAKMVNGEIISADSMQIYRHMDIGTAKIKLQEMEGIPHYLIDELEPQEEFNVVRFQQLARQYMDQIYGRGHIPILVGGTGFYIQAVLYDIDFSEQEEDLTYRRELEQLLAKCGGEYLYEMLQKEDRESAAAIHPNNYKRIIRALEYNRQTGDKISRHNKEQRSREAAYHFCYFVLNKDRAVLYKAIDQRVDKMLQEGLLEEVKFLAAEGYTRELVSMQGLGYKELLAHLAGECSLSEAVERIKRDTRHFAKRQLTWFRREKEVYWIEKEAYASEQELLEQLLDILRQKEII